jgi:DHA1 family multidrug resistance protein-like MFS transporter
LQLNKSPDIDNISSPKALKRTSVKLPELFQFNELWKKNLTILALAQFIAVLGMMAAVPFLPNYVMELGVPAEDAKTWSGLVFSGVYISGLLFIPLWGSLGDKYGRKNMAIRAIFGLAISVTLMGFAQNIYQLFALRLIQGALSGFIPASLAFISANTPESKSGYAIGVLQSANAAGNISGPIFGGLFSDAFGVRDVFIIIGSLCLIAGILVTVFVKENKESLTQTKGLQVFRNLSYVLSRGDLRTIFILIILTQVAIQITIPIFPFFVTAKGAPQEFLSSITGYLFAVIALFSVISAPIIGKMNDQKRWYKVLIFTAPVAASAIILHTTAPHYFYLFPYRAIFGIVLPGLIPSFYAALSKRSPSAKKSGIMGIASAATLLGSLIGFLSSGYISTLFGLESVFFVSTSCLLIVFFVSLYKNKHGEGTISHS